jgi:hypothetical protein
MSDNAKDFGIVKPGEDGFEFWTYGYPQLGGYCAKSRVTFEPTSGSSELEPGCFHVEVWHDGDFPFSEKRQAPVTLNCPVCEFTWTDIQPKPAHLHHCAAEQFIDFGLAVLEAQVVHQRALNGGPVAVDVEWKERALARLQALPARPRTAR